MDAGYWILDTGQSRILDTGQSWMLDTGYWTIMDTGYWILDTGYWTIMDTGYWILESTPKKYFNRELVHCAFHFECQLCETYDFQMTFCLPVM